MIRKTLTMYTLILGMVLLAQALDEFPELETESLIGGALFVLIAGPMIVWYHEERRKARERLLHNARRKRASTK